MKRFAVGAKFAGVYDVGVVEEPPLTKDDLRKAIHALANATGIVIDSAAYLWEQHPALRHEGLGDIKEAADRLPEILAQLRRFL